MVKYSQSEKPSDNETSDRVWLSVESFLIAVANVSKILWPSLPKCKRCGYQPKVGEEVSSRVEDLRNILSIDKSSPLANRHFRNFFEHYDFQLEDWVKKSSTQLVYDSNVGPIESVIKSSNESVAIIRHFDQYESIIYFRGKQYDVKPVVEALQELKAKTESMSL